MCKNNNKVTISKLENLSSLFVILVLAIVILLVFYVQSHFDPIKLGFESAIADNLDQQYDIPFDIHAIVPPKWVYLGDLEKFDSEQLYEKIDGKAPLYLDSGFNQLYTQKIVNSDNEENWVEIYIYDMGNGENAFSVFSVQRRPAATGIAGILASYCTDNAAFAVVDKYYLEVIGANVSQETIEGVKSAVLNFNKPFIANKPVANPFEILFPSENLIADSASLIKADAFGFEYFKDTYISEYQIDGEKIKAFVIRCGDDEIAAKLNNIYRKFLTENGFKKTDTIAKGLDGIYEFEGVFEIVFSEGCFVGGIHESYNRQSAEQLAKKMAENLKGNLSDDK